jgi:glucosamine-6-phosphate deaminase
MDLSRVRWFALDEFLGAVPAAATFGHFLRQRLVAACRVPEQCLHVLHAGCADPVQEGARYEAEIAAAGGLDLAILGIGENGHIGFNEPGTPFCSRTGHRLLDEKTRRANAYLFARLEDVPVQGISMGIGTILSARAVLLLAVGAGKAEVMERLAAASPEPSLPASALKTHGNVLAVMDEEAAGSTRL